jgi:uncharacterized phage protein (TIGR02220 family)
MHYYQFNVADYRKDTSHLTPIEHYIYRFLIDWYYLDETPIPAETQQVLRRLSLGSDSIQNLQNVLNDFFIKGENGYSQKRIDEEIDAYHNRADTSRENGRLGGRPKKTQQVILGNLEKPKQKATNNQEPITINQELYIEVLDYLNQKASKNYKPVRANLDLIKARINEGYTKEDMFTVIDNKCIAWLEDKKMNEYLRPATLFNATNLAQYTGEESRNSFNDIFAGAI